MIRKEKGYALYSIDKISINNIETYIRNGLSFKKAVKKEILSFYKEDKESKLFLSNCRFYENVVL